MNQGAGCPHDGDADGSRAKGGPTQGDRVTSKSVVVEGGTQAVFSDVAGAMGVVSSAALEVVSDRPVGMTSRTYSSVPGEASCLANGTSGQDFMAYGSGEALKQGQVAWLPNLRENSSFRTNIGLTNSGADQAVVTVSLLDDTGAELASYTKMLAAGEWNQELRPFFSHAGMADVAGYAKVTVISGTGVLAYASVVDNVTNDPTTVTAVPDETRDTVLWIPVASHKSGARGTEWRSDLALLNTSPSRAAVEVRWRLDGDVRTLSRDLLGGVQLRLDDVVGQLGAEGSGPVEIRSDRSLIAHSRSYTLASGECADRSAGTLGQSYAAARAGQAISAGQDAWLPQLAENAAYRTNLGFTNTGSVTALLTVTMFDGAGSALESFPAIVPPGEFLQEIRPFTRRAGRGDISRGYAKVHIDAGSEVIAYASVIDNITNDPTTVTMMR